MRSLSQMSQAFLTEIPARPDSILNIVAHGWRNKTAPVQVAISSLESASAVFSARLLYPDLPVDFGEIPEPDPRVPFEKVGIQIWEYSGTEAKPAIPAPPSRVRSAFEKVLANEFSLDRWAITARELGRELQPISSCEILGAAIHPPPYPRNAWPWNCLFRSQVMSLLILAMADEDDYLTSSKGRHVLDVLHGPVDWTTTAALVALTARTRHDGRCDPALLAKFLDLLKRPMSPIWFMCVYRPIWQLLQHFPGLDPKFREMVCQTVAKLEANEEEA